MCVFGVKVKGQGFRVLGFRVCRDGLGLRV